LEAIRAEFASYEARLTTIAGHTHLERALGLAEDLLQSQAPADEKQRCSTIVRLYAERLKRGSDALFRDRDKTSRERLALTFANMKLFEVHDVGISQEFFELTLGRELIILLKKPVSKWDDKDYRELDRYVQSLGAKQ
jgi:hypothetical protein